jgi:MarR family transcriptional regulator for hemolysin
MQWCDPSNICFAIKTAVRAMEKAFDYDLRKTAGVTLSQARVIRALIGKDGITQKEIAENIAVEAPTLVPMIDKMEQDGLLERRQDEADRRNNRVYLTYRSRVISEKIDESFVRVRRASQKGISKEDVETLRQVLYKIAENATDYLESQAPAEIAKVK